MKEEYELYDIKNLNIYDIIEKKDEQRLKKLVINILIGIIKGYEEKNETSYFPSYLGTIPMELGWKDNYQVKDPILDKALDMIANFEGDTEEEAKEKSKAMLKELRNDENEQKSNMPKNKEN